MSRTTFCWFLGILSLHYEYLILFVCLGGFSLLVGPGINIVDPGTRRGS